MPDSPSWDAIGEEVTAHLQYLNRLETVNPPGSRTLVARHVADPLYEIVTRFCEAH